jgi:hypothetical protein
MSAEENLQRMKSLDDARNAQNWECSGSGARRTRRSIGPVSRMRHAAATRTTPSPTRRSTSVEIRRGRLGYDPVAKIFVGTVNNIVTNVINGVSPKYIENLKGAL